MEEILFVFASLQDALQITLITIPIHKKILVTWIPGGKSTFHHDMSTSGTINQKKLYTTKKQ